MRPFLFIFVVMNRKLSILLVLLITSLTTLAQKKRSDNPHGPGEDIYKHYTGTVGDRKVTLDLLWGYQGGSNYGGSMVQFSTESEPLLMHIAEPPTFEHGKPLRGELTKLTDVKNKPASEWTFTVGEKTLTGTAKDLETGATQTINLNENYDRSMKFDLRVEDKTSKMILPGTKDKPLCKISAMYVLPDSSIAQPKAVLVKYHLSKLFGGAVANPSEFATMYLRSFEEYCTPKAKQLPEEHAAKLNFSCYALVTPVYNDNNLLVIKISETKSMSATHYDKIHYVVLDLENNVQLTDEEIISLGNKSRINGKLEKELRRIYAQPTEKMGKWTLKDYLPETTPEHTYPTANGIVFHYEPNEVFKDTPVDIFLPYTELKDYIAEPLKNKLKIK